MLFDNGWYSVVAGKYEDEPAIGERWNGEGSNAGFPSQGGHPTFHVVPRFLCVGLLHGLLDQMARKPHPGHEDHLAATMKQLWVELQRAAEQ